MVATVEQLAALVRGRLLGDGSVPIHAARPVGDAGPGDITFIENERYARMLRTSPASAAIVGPHFKRTSAAPELPTIEVDDPIVAFLAVRSHLKGAPRPRWSGVHPQAFVAPNAKLGENVAIYPFAYVGDEAEIGDGATLYPGVVVGERCTLGKDVVLHANVVLYDEVTLGDRVEVHSGTVIGGDGFGYRLVDGRHVKIPQTGKVVVGDDVEIGANCAVDRATFEATRIGDGSKIDNLVMIGHNNQIGRHNLLCAQVGDRRELQDGRLRDHGRSGGDQGPAPRSAIGPSSTHNPGSISNIPPNQQVFGTPARSRSARSGSFTGCHGPSSRRCNANSASLPRRSPGCPRSPLIVAEARRDGGRTDERWTEQLPKAM